MKARYTAAEYQFIRKCKREDDRFTEKDKDRLYKEMVDLAKRFADTKMANKIAMAFLRNCSLRTFDQLRTVDMRMVSKFDNIGPKSLKAIEQMKDYISQDDGLTESLLNPGKKITWEEKYKELVRILNRIMIYEEASDKLKKIVVDKTKNDFEI